MKIPSVLLVFSFALFATASSVLWNDGFTLSQGGASSASAWLLCWNKPEAAGESAECLYPTIEMTTSSDSGETRISAVEEVTVGYGYQWVEMQEGQTVSSDTTRNLDRYYLKGWFDWIPGQPTDEIGKSDYSILVPDNGNSPFYLGFAAEMAKDGELSVVYGWVQLFADGENLRLGNTAIDLSGASLVVGQVPEPMSGALALFGAFLLLRRRGSAPARNRAT